MLTAELSEKRLTLNVIFTPRTFRYLHPFMMSLVANSDARFRIVANGCDAEETRALRAYADAMPARVEMCRLTGDEMVPHGVALDELFETFDDGSHFCFIDTDVKARAAFLPQFIDDLGRYSVVTSGRVAWSDDAVLPPGAKDLAGRYFVDPDGFVYGSSYVAFYTRAPVQEMRARYGVSFRANAHANLSAEIQSEIAGLHRTFELYDTAKVLNLLLQANGYSVHHVDHDELVHVGGISQYLSHPQTRNGTAAPGERPWFASTPSGARRWDFAQWAAGTLVGLVDGGALPELPADDTDRAASMQLELRDLVGRYTAA